MRVNSFNDPGRPAADAERRWFKRFGRRESSPDIRLLCFHHAGGAAAAFRRWPQELPASVALIAVQLPGRADRFGEAAFDRMPPLVDQLVERVGPLLDRPFAFYGASMGARVAWTLAHALRERALPVPRMLFVASNSAPCHDDGTFGWDRHLDDLAGYLREMGGTPEEVLAEPELVEALLPTLRADLDLLASHRFRPEVPLDIPIHAFAGVDDLTDPPERVRGWAFETTARFELDEVAGGHFHSPDTERAVIRAVVRDLLRQQVPDHGGHRSQPVGTTGCADSRR